MNDEIKAAQEFLETCKQRYAEAQRRFGLATQNLQRAQQEFANAQVEHNNWQGVLASETARVALLQKAAQANQTLLPMAQPQPPGESVPKQATAPESNTSDVNKTELVRELLGQHPEGMTPTEIWAVVKNQIPRPYLYSILKRLKDADEVIYQRRRKKYSLRVTSKQEEVPKEQQQVVH